AVPRDAGASVLEVEALRDLLHRLVERVVHLLPVNLADDVERRIGGHRLLLSVGPSACHQKGFAFRPTAQGILSFAQPAHPGPARPGRLPEWPKGTVCKTVGIAY